MGRWTAEDIFESFANRADVGGRRVHWQRGVPFHGHPGHYYIFRRRRDALSNEDLAQITARSGNPEVTLTQINDTYIVHIGNRGIATATLSVPGRQDGIEEFRWIAHTHPLEQENAYQMIAHGPTREDRAALRRVSQLWQQTESTVVVCRGGRVEAVVPFTLEQDDAAGSGPGGRIWTPDTH